MGHTVLFMQISDFTSMATMTGMIPITEWLNDSNDWMIPLVETQANSH